MKEKWKQRLQKLCAAVKKCRPVLEIRYAEDTGFYPYGDADGKAVLCRSEGLLQTDLRKIGGVLAVFGVLLYLRLRRH